MKDFFTGNQIRWKPLIINVLISWAVAAAAGFLTSGSMELYSNIRQPKLAPPGWVFPVVWGILFTLMGISAYFVYVSNADSKKKSRALSLYGVQLLLNFLWSLIFFNLQAYLLAFVWLVVLWICILGMIILFYKIEPAAGILQIPYLLWVAFAGYLNIMIWNLNS